MPQPSVAQSVNRAASARNIPLSALLELTRQCNARCYYCGIPLTKKSGELSFGQWQKVLRQLSDAGCLYLVLSGGEPFLRPDLFEIISEARDLGFATSLISNGSKIDAKAAQKLSQLGVMDVGISLLASKASIHDRLSGIKGGFTAALRALGHLHSAGVRTLVKHTVSSETDGEYRSLGRMAKKSGALFECDSVVFPSEQGRPSNHTLNLDQHRRFLKFMKAGPRSLVTGKADVSNLHCDAGRSLCGISPYGDVLPCIQLPLSFGNLKKKSFREIWEGKKARDFRRQEKNTDAECSNCDVRPFCSKCPGLSFGETGNWQGKAPSACVRARALAEIRTKDRS